MLIQRYPYNRRHTAMKKKKQMTVNSTQLIRISKVLTGSLAFAMVLLLSACGGSGGTAVPAPIPPPTSPPPGPTPGQGFVPQTTFSDRSATAGINHIFTITSVISTSEPAHMGGGIAAADVDEDQLIDLYLVGGDGNTNMLFRNNGNNQFSDVSVPSNLDVVHMGSGPAFADIDGDGDLDLFIGSVEGGQIYLFRNDGNSFTDITQNSGINVTAENTISASFSDYDLDGDVDLFVTHWGNQPQTDTESLWQNNGDGTFTSASIQSGIADQLIEPTVGIPDLFDFSFAPVFTDIDGDRDPDLLLASDFGTSAVFKNNGDGTFSKTTDRDVIIDRNGMGNSAGDYDNDGDMDWFVTSIYEEPTLPDANYGNRLYRNLGDGTFEDVTEAAGVANGGWGWGSCIEDFDNDGDLDLFHVNGWNRDNPRDPGSNDQYVADQVRYFESQGDGTFVEAATEAGLLDTGQGRGTVCFDSDRDGDLDIVITNNEDVNSVVFYRNDLTTNNHYLGVRLEGGGLNTAGIGARIEIEHDSTLQMREIRAGNNFVSQSPAEAHFGLGSAQIVDITVFWPDGSQSVLTNVVADQLLTVNQP